MAWVVVDVVDLDLNLVFSDMEWIMVNIVELEVMLLSEETRNAASKGKQEKM